jgi:hypothetical protein
MRILYSVLSRLLGRNGRCPHGSRVIRASCAYTRQKRQPCIPFALHLKPVLQKPGNSIVFDTPESTPAPSKKLMSKCRVAGRRGFEPRLPLHFQQVSDITKNCTLLHSIKTPSDEASSLPFLILAPVPIVNPIQGRSGPHRQMRTTSSGHTPACLRAGLRMGTSSSTRVQMAASRFWITS